MKIKMDPVTVIIVSILLGWGWTELTNEPVCQQEVVKEGAKYTIPIHCKDIPQT